MSLQNSARVVLKLGDDISTDAIYPGRYMATVLPAETPRYAFADLAGFNARLQKKEIAPGSIVIGGLEFRLRIVPRTGGFCFEGARSW